MGTRIELDGSDNIAQPTHRDVAAAVEHVLGGAGDFLILTDDSRPDEFMQFGYPETDLVVEVRDAEGVFRRRSHPNAERAVEPMWQWLGLNPGWAPGDDWEIFDPFA